MMKNLLVKHGTLILAIVSAVSILFGSLIGYNTSADYEKEEAFHRLYNAIHVVFKGNPTIEYGDSFHPEELVESYQGKLAIESEVNTKSVGQYTVTYALSDQEETFNQEVTRPFERVIVVEDTKAPIIEIEAEELKYTIGSEMDIESNILSVKDVVDGELEKKDSLQPGSYIIDTELDEETAGEYPVTIKAMDINGNESESSFTVKVKKKNTRRVYYNDNYDEIYRFLTEDMGLNRAGACGIIGNMWVESNFRPDVGSGYYGLCQWGGGRWSHLQSYCANHGYGAYTVKGQLEFLKYELESEYPNLLSRMRNVEDSSEGAYEASSMFFYEFERGASFSERGNISVGYYDN